MRKKGNVLIFAIIFLIIFLIYFTNSQSKQVVDVGDKAYNFNLMDITGSITHTLDDYSGKIVVLNFFNTWCEPCLEEIPELEKFNKYSYENDVQLLIIDKGESQDIVYDFVQNNNLSSTFLLDTNLNVSKSYKIIGQPETIIIGKDGVIKEHIYGKISFDLLINKINYYR